MSHAFAHRRGTASSVYRHVELSGGEIEIDPGGKRESVFRFTWATGLEERREHHGLLRFGCWARDVVLLLTAPWAIPKI